MRTPERLFQAYILDLDGTTYLGDTMLPTAGWTISHLRRLGCRVVFLSNNPTRTREGYAQKLARLGIPTAPADVINSSFVMVEYLRHHLPEGRLFVVGEASLRQELASAGFELTAEAGRVDAIIASFDRTFDYGKLQIAFDAIRSGARFFATNADRFCPVPGGGQPDAAAMIAAIEACTGTQVEAVVGKPSSIMAAVILQQLDLPAEQCLMVGDRLETDIKMGLEAGMATALTLTGVTDVADLDGSGIQPDYVIRQLAELMPGTYVQGDPSGQSSPVVARKSFSTAAGADEESY